jgi:RHS repeat-associated protein
MISNGGTGYSYDAESRLRSTAGVTYSYDGDGNRVMKSNGTLYWGWAAENAPLAETDLSGGNEKDYVFFGGKRVARVDAGGSVHYYLTDHLGSSSVVANASGGIENESDFYPYGGEMVITQTLANQNYKFTGKERDSESNLDNFGARYYGSSLGRFMTPDWAARPTAVPYAVFGDPQSLNLYGYVRNDPVSAVDADGHGGDQVCMNGHFCDPNKTASGETKKGGGTGYRCKLEKNRKGQHRNRWWRSSDHGFNSHRA